MYINILNIPWNNLTPSPPVCTASEGVSDFFFGDSPSLFLGLDLLLPALFWPYSNMVLSSSDSLIVKDNSELRRELREDLDH